jgi:hypothetical protein
MCRTRYASLFVCLIITTVFGMVACGPSSAITDLVTIRYKETLVTNSSINGCEPLPRGALALYEITSVENTDANPHDFTLELSRLYEEHDANPTNPTGVPWNLASAGCGSLRSSVHFSSNDIFVAAGTASKPLPGTESFVLNLGGDSSTDIIGIVKLRYRADTNQHILMIADTTTAPKVFQTLVSLDVADQYGK